MFDDEDDENNKIFIRLCPEHLTEILRRSKPRPRPKPDKLKYYRVTKYTVDQDMDGTGEIVKEGYDYRGDGYLNESMSVHSNEKEPYKYRYLIEEVPAIREGIIKMGQNMFVMPVPFAIGYSNNLMPES